MADNSPSHASCQLLTARDVAALLKVHVGSVWRLTAMSEANLPCNGFPRPVRLGPKTVRWRLSDLETYLTALAQEKR